MSLSYVNKEIMCQQGNNNKYVDLHSFLVSSAESRLGMATNNGELRYWLRDGTLLHQVKCSKDYFVRANAG